MIDEVKAIVPTMVKRKRGEEREVITFDLLRKGDVFWFLGRKRYATGQPVYIAKSDAEPYGPEEECNYAIEADNA